MLGLETATNKQADFSTWLLQNPPPTLLSTIAYSLYELSSWRHDVSSLVMSRQGLPAAFSQAPSYKLQALAIN